MNPQRNLDEERSKFAKIIVPIILVLATLFILGIIFWSVLYRPGETQNPLNLLMIPIAIVSISLRWLIFWVVTGGFVAYVIYIATSDDDAYRFFFRLVFSVIVFLALLLVWALSAFAFNWI